MNSLKKYFEDTGYLTDSGFPEQWLNAEDYEIAEGTFSAVTFQHPGGVEYTLLEITIPSQTFVAIAHENDEWLGYHSVEDYVADVFGSDIEFYDVDMG